LRRSRPQTHLISTGAILRRTLVPVLTPPAFGTTQPAATDSAESNKITEAAVRQRTGHSWRTWFRRLDEWGAADRRHADIARWLMTEHGLDNWSAAQQGVRARTAQRLEDAPGGLTLRRPGCATSSRRQRR
jgi:Domain of unknown function (DUF4287)